MTELFDRVSVSAEAGARMGGLLQARIARKSVEAIDVASFELVSADGAALPAFSAGAHIDLHLPNGQVRQYSLCNDPAESGRYVVAVLKDDCGRGGSRAMHELREGDTLCIGQPRNHFPLAPDAAHSVLLAGGIGVTPMLSMAQRLSTLGASFSFHYCARSNARMAFRERILTSTFADRVSLHLDDGAPTQRLDVEGVTARPQEGVQLYVCGPGGFIDAVLSSARKHGWREQDLHSERFTAAPRAPGTDMPFDLQLARSGRMVHVPAGQSAAHALAAAGIEVPTSCEQGVCGTCFTHVLDGEPDHRDMYLTTQERERNDCFLPCCSRSHSSVLVIDL